MKDWDLRDTQEKLKTINLPKLQGCNCNKNKISREFAEKLVNNIITYYFVDDEYHDVFEKIKKTKESTLLQWEKQGFLED